MITSAKDLYSTALWRVGSDRLPYHESCENTLLFRSLLAVSLKFSWLLFSRTLHLASVCCEHCASCEFSRLPGGLIFFAAATYHRYVAIVHAIVNQNDRCNFICVNIAGIGRI